MDYNKQKNSTKKLAQKYRHNIEFNSGAIYLRSSVNEISIVQKNKSQITLTYNMDFTTKTIDLEDDNYFDVLIKLLKRSEFYSVLPRRAELLGLKHYLVEENSHAYPELKRLKKQIKEGTVVNCELFGNRITVEVFDGILILVDEIDIYNSNVIDLKEVDKFVV